VFTPHNLRKQKQS